MKYLLLAVPFLFTSVLETRASEQSKYDFSWLDQDKEVYVLQNRKFRKDGKVSISVLGGKTISGEFTKASLAQARLDYFFLEQWGIELLYSSNYSKENDTAAAVFNSSQVVPFIRKAKNYYGGMLLWSPFYAKMNTFNLVMYFDWIFGVGAASFTDENNKNRFQTSATSEWTQQTTTGPMWDVGMRLYLTPSWSLRMDMTGVHYKATRYGYRTSDSKIWFNNYDFVGGINFTF